MGRTSEVVSGTAVLEVRPCQERQQLRGEGEAGMRRKYPERGQEREVLVSMDLSVCVQCLAGTPVCSCTAVGSPGLCCCSSASENTGCDGIQGLGERRNDQLLQSVFQRPSHWCGARALPIFFSFRER